MGEKLSFDVDNVNLIDENENSSFAILEIDFFASGLNRHNMTVSEDVLTKTSDSIHMKPVVWKYDAILDDIGSHSTEEIPGGFVPENAEIKSRVLPDGRTMLSTIAFIWKKYSGDLLEFFKRDGNNKPVSVEINVFDSEEFADGVKNLKDFAYEAITILGNAITPAIPLAQSTVIQFAIDKQEYEKAYNLEFGYGHLDFSIPKKVKDNANQGLELVKKHNIGMDSVSLSLGRHISKSDKSNPDKIKHITKVFSGHRFDNRDKKEPSTSYVKFLLYGGEDGKEWSSKLSKKIDEEDNKNSSYFSDKVTFPYTKAEDMNPALKGIDPPITAEQGSEIARIADGIGANKNGWPIAISNWKKSHEVKDGHWVKKESKMSLEGDIEKEKMSMEDEKDKKEVEMEAKTPPKEETPEEEKKETPAEEKKEDKEEQKKEEKEGTEEKMSSDAYADVKAFLAVLKKETENNENMSGEEDFAKMFEDASATFDFPKACSAAYKYACKMSAKFEKMEAENKTYMSENEDLKKFKADMEAKQMNYEVDSTMKDVEKCGMPVAEMEALKEKAKEFSVETVDAWKNLVKAKAFEFSAKTEKEDGPKKFALPWGTKEATASTSVWDKI